MAQFFIVPFATGKLKVRDSILIIMDLAGKKQLVEKYNLRLWSFDVLLSHYVLGGCIQSLIFAFVQSEWMLYLGVCISFLDHTTWGMIRSVITKLIPNNEFGAVMSFIGKLIINTVQRLGR